MYGTSPRCAARVGRRSHTTRQLRQLLDPPAPAAALLVGAGARTSPVPPKDHTRCGGPLACSGPGRSYSTGTKPPRHVAVLGGGLTGLTTAYYLTKNNPGTRVTIYEASDRLGGWPDTETVAVKTADGREGTVLWERGPRTVMTQHNKAKWDDLFLYELIDKLGLHKEVSFIPQNANLARYIYYPDHLVKLGPVRVPRDGNVLGAISENLRLASTVFTEPLFSGLWPSAYHWFSTAGERVKRKRDPTGGAQDGRWAFDCQDISIGDYFADLFGRPDLVDNALSAMMHGIYGGDVWNLSMESSPWQAALVAAQARSQHPGSTYGLIEDHTWAHEYARSDWARSVREMARRVRGGGYLYFREGFSTLTNAMATALENNPQVKIKLQEPVRSLSLDGSLQVAVSTNKTAKPALYDKVVSTIFAGTLAGLTDGALPTLAESEAVTIRLVNLWYPKPMLNYPHHGFGYLVPQSVPLANNPENVLGVLFDSDRELFTQPPRPDAVAGTTLTVMMGGHLWDGLPSSFLPDAEQSVELAKLAVERHLGIPATERVFSGTKLCEMCIPQHRVGHYRRMARAHSELQSAFRGRLMVAGPSYTAPGVLTSIRAGREASTQVRDSWPSEAGALSTIGDTGLERFLPGRRKWQTFDGPQSLPLRHGNF